MAQQPRKTKRGLGRGLGALIQDTSVENRPVDDQDLETTDAGKPAFEEEVSQEVKEKPAKKKIAAEKTGKDLTSRYLATTGARAGKRRPADLFFGDEPNAGETVTKKSSRTTMPNPLLSRNVETQVDSEQSSDAFLRDIPVKDITPNRRQPRDEFDEEAMQELVASINEVGVLQPIVVRPIKPEGSYELIMGERRWRATQRAGLDTIPAIVRDTADEDLLRDALLENIHRSELNSLEEAAAYQQLMKDFGWSQEILAKRVGRSRPHISNTLRLMNLPPAVQRQVAAGVLSAGHARAILGVQEEHLMLQLTQRIIDEGLSVRATEELASLLLRNAQDKQRTPLTPRRNTRQFDDLASSLTDLLDTQVKITLGAKKGKIAIDFASVDDLNRIMAVLNRNPEDS